MPPLKIVTRLVGGFKETPLGSTLHYHNLHVLQDCECKGSNKLLEKQIVLVKICLYIWLSQKFV